MSDQVPSQGRPNEQFDGSNLIGIGGGGVTRINGDPTPHQILAAGPGITIIDGGGGVHTFSTAGSGITSINGDVTAAQHLLAGAGINILNAGANHTFSVTFPASLKSINGDTTAAQTLAAGAGVTIVDGGGGLHTISVTPGAGIISINADNTVTQHLLTGTTALTIVDGGGGNHTFSIASFAGAAAGLVPTGSGGDATKYLSGAGTWVKVPGFFAFQASILGGNPVLNGPNTFGASVVVATLPDAAVHNCLIVYHAGVIGIAGQFLNISLFINGVFQTGSSIGAFPEFTGQTLDLTGTIDEGVKNGDTVAVVMTHHGGGAATLSTISFVQGIMLSL